MPDKKATYMIVASDEDHARLHVLSLGASSRGHCAILLTPDQFGEIMPKILDDEILHEKMAGDGDYSKELFGQIESVFRRWKLKRIGDKLTGHGVSISESHFFKRLANLLDP